MHRRKASKVEELVEAAIFTRYSQSALAAVEERRKADKGRIRAGRDTRVSRYLAKLRIHPTPIFLWEVGGLTLTRDQLLEYAKTLGFDEDA